MDGVWFGCMHMTTYTNHPTTNKQNDTNKQKTTALARRLLRDILLASSSSSTDHDNNDNDDMRVLRERLTYLTMLVEGATAGEGWRDPVRFKGIVCGLLFRV